MCQLLEKDVPGVLLTKDVRICNITELRRWLECHGLKQGGNKSELIDRVNDCTSINMPVDEKVDGGKWYKMKEQKILNENFSSSTVIGISIPASGWLTLSKEAIPVWFNKGHIYHYLGDYSCFTYNEYESSHEDSEALTVERTFRKGKELVKSRFVDNVQGNENDFVTYGHTFIIP